MSGSVVRLGREAFNRPTLAVARDLLGKFIVHRAAGRVRDAMIAEVEAYRGPLDRASHAYGGRRTPRVGPLYRDGGTAYVYLVYGLHWLLNFSTVGVGIPEGVLVRAIFVARANRLLAGPGKVTRHLGIDKAQDGIDVARSTTLWLEDRALQVPRDVIRSGVRIGIDYAGPYWAAKRWRFWIDEAFLHATASGESPADTRTARSLRSPPASTAWPPATRRSRRRT